MSNQFQGVGNLGAKPALKHVELNGETVPVAKVRIHFDRRVPNKLDGTVEERGGFWITAALWGDRAERLAALLDTGMRVYAAGALHADTWIDPASTEPRTEMRLRLDYLALDLARVKAIEMEPRKPRGEAE
jgi:single-strand DNA-binding protein